MPRPSVGLLVLFSALIVPVLAGAAGRVYQSNEEQRAKEGLAQTKAETQQDQQALDAKIRAQKERLEAEAESKKDSIQSNARQEVQELEADTREQKQELDQEAREKRERLDARLDAAEEKVDTQAESAGAPQPGAAAPVQGVITSVNAEGHIVTIREQRDAAAGPITPAGTLVTPLAVADGVEVQHAGEALALRDVQVGDRVQAHLEHDAQGLRRVHRIVILERPIHANVN